MAYRICKSFEIENGHILSRHPDKCRFPHGHSRKVEFVLVADDLDPNGMVCDFKLIKDLMGDVLETFDHATCVNTEDPHFPALREMYGDRIIPFTSEEPTTEALARLFFVELERRLDEAAHGGSQRFQVRAAVRVERVRVWETSSSWAEYSA